MEETFRAPVRRTKLRLFLGARYYTARRRLQWLFGGYRFARSFQSELLPHRYAAHRTPLLRRLKDVDMQMQYNKISNLRLAIKKLDGLLLQPGETFSFWKSVGKPTRRKGYKEGLVLFCGAFGPGVGGGLCQLTNLLYWMTLHTPLTVVERYRHSYDVFPDVNRTQPFGSGATCVYNYRDLMLRNNTQQAFQLHLYLTETDLAGEWRCSAKPLYRYEIYEKGHAFRQEYWGGYSRHNELRRRVFSQDDVLLDDEYVTENHALLCYVPFLPETSSGKSSENSSFA